MTSPESSARDPIETAVFEAFQEIVNRLPTQAEAADWSAKLLRGTPVRALREALGATAKPPPAARDPEEAMRVVEAGLLDASWYRARYPDVAEAGMTPARHYTEHGWREDRAANGYIDLAWYRATHDLPGIGHPLLHYLLEGERAGFRPSPLFDPEWYRANFAVRPEACALADFLRRRPVDPVAPSAALWAGIGLRKSGMDIFPGLAGTVPDTAVLRDAGVFDENYYALHSGDVLAAGTDLLAHYCEFGWREDRQPNFYFDSRWYAATNPDVVRLGVNPLTHYVLVGEKAGRRPIVFFDPVWYRKTNAVPAGTAALAHFLEHRRDGNVSPNEFFDPEYHAAQKGETVRKGRDPFARFLISGLTEDFAPSAAFDLAAWRRRTRGRVSRNFRHLLDPAKDNPLADYLLRTYR